MLKTLLSPLIIVKDGLILWWDEWINWIVISILWTLCWLTIVLGPPATFGIYFIAGSLVDGESLGVRGMLDGGREYFAKSWLWMAVNVAVVALITYNIFFYSQVETYWAQLIEGILLFIGLLWITVQLYAIAYLIRQEEKSLRMAWRNALFTILASPYHALIVFIFIFLLLALSLLTVLPIFFGFPGLVVVLANRAVKDRVNVFKSRLEEERKESSRSEDGGEI
jgi:uncharacterized membrane protein YesL